MSIAPIQCRLGRVLLGWTAQELAAAANVAVNTVTKFERGKDARVSTVTALQAALEEAGVAFIADAAASPGGGLGVRRAAEEPKAARPRSGGLSLGFRLGL